MTRIGPNGWKLGEGPTRVAYDLVARLVVVGFRPNRPAGAPNNAKVTGSFDWTAWCDPTTCPVGTYSWTLTGARP